MGNPILELMNQGTGNTAPATTGSPTIQNNFSNMFRMMNAVKNPMAFLQNQFSQTQIGQAMNLVKQNGGDARAAFYNLAKQKGINPDDILNQLR